MPSGWVLASSLKPSPAPQSVPLVFHAKEVADGKWQRRGEVVSYEALLRELEIFGSLDPQPRFLFEFAGGHSCDELNKLRDDISKAAKCSSDGIPCFQGTMTEFPFRSQ